MKIGAYYYPEQWPRDQWPRDFDRFAAMGLQIIHLAEFAWHSLEPRQGEFHFDWLDTCLNMSRQRGLDVILCTPTAAPPVWLVAKYPEILPIDERGTRARPGGRHHYSPTSPAMRDAATRIVSAMAERYGDHPSVIGWQIDNEYCGAFDQNDHAHAAFRSWLARKYGSIDALNQAWASQFWNQYYDDFGQILFPASRDPNYCNPHQHLDASRFWSWAWADFNRLQANILKPRVGDRFITTNFMLFHLDANPLDMADDLSLMSWDSYPVTGWEKNVKDETYRLADPNSIGLMHELMASFNGRWAQMELQPGQINWSSVPVLLYPGAVRLWIWTAFAHGAEFVTTYRFRQPRWGIEMFHHGLLRPDGTTLSQGGEEFAQTISEMARLTRSSPSCQEERRQNEAPSVGLMIDYDQFWYFKTLPQARRWDALAWIRQWYGALARLGLRVQVVHPSRPWPSGLRMMVAPAIQMIDDELISRFQQFVAGGGHLVLTCRTGWMDRNGHLFEGPVAAPIVPLIGGQIREYDVLPDDAYAQVQMDGQRYHWGAWGDQILPHDNQTQVLATYADQFYAGAAAVTQRRPAGGGIVTYCGACAENAFTDALTEKLARQSNLPITPLPPRVHLLERDGYHVLLNYSLEPVQAPSPDDARFIVGQRSVPPAGVAVWVIR